MTEEEEEEEEEEEMMIVAQPRAKVKEPGSRWSLSSSAPASGFGAEIQDTLVGFYFCFGGREGSYREGYWAVHSLIRYCKLAYSAWGSEEEREYNVKRGKSPG